MTTAPYDPAARWEALKVRMDALAAQRHADRLAKVQATTQARETHLRNVVDAAVAEAFKGLTLPSTMTGTAPAAGFSESAPEVSPGLPTKELHQMDSEEWRTHAATRWSASLPRHAPGPRTVSDLLASFRPSDSDEG